MGLLPPDPTDPEAVRNAQVNSSNLDRPQSSPDLRSGHVESDSRECRQRPHLQLYWNESIATTRKNSFLAVPHDVDLFASYGLTQKASACSKPVFAAPGAHADTRKLVDFLLGGAMTAAPTNSPPKLNAFIRSA